MSYANTADLDFDLFLVTVLETKDTCVLEKKTF